MFPPNPLNYITYLFWRDLEVYHWAKSNWGLTVQVGFAGHGHLIQILRIQCWPIIVKSYVFTIIPFLVLQLNWKLRESQKVNYQIGLWEKRCAWNGHHDPLWRAVPQLQKKTLEALTFTYNQRSQCLDLWPLGEECRTLNLSAVHCQAPPALQAFKFSFQQAKSPKSSPCHKRKENLQTKEKKQQKTVTTHWGALSLLPK